MSGLSEKELVAPIQGFSPMLEGEFTTYTQKWTQTISNVLATQFNVTGSRIMTADLLNDASYVREVSDGSAVDDDTFNNGINVFIGHFVVTSVMGKYMARIISDDTIEVWKNGTLLQNIDTGAGANDIQAIGLSSDGKYLLISDGTDNILYLYEGS